ncbi:uncharacterized protein F5147DRAFT_660578 [Suillus discolor]|uniref:Uncharacterized protein n=1 Tax=Suillus discolor TaxID=1912936 RepID=A0A9P7EQ60_9AGAM|nr:uncharacterized protein F5147DRAFT_660578 [Suillus discolor]KAG2082120.1 hypothetical protein F5147DRAFT_660578 [Suillus discolor]
MVRTKPKSCKGPPSPHAAEASPRKRRKGAVPTGNTTLLAINKVKERAKQQHKHAKKTRENYNGYVERGQTWLKAHFATSRGAVASMDSETMSISTDAYEDPTFRDALERMPNQHSDKALALLISFKCFHENCGQSMCDGTYSAFKKFWEEADGDTYCGRWHFNEACLCWEGNPTSSAEVQDIIKSVKHKTSSEGGDRTHSIAMSKGFMDRILAWTHKLCPPETFLGLMRSVLAADTMSTEPLTLESRELLTKMTMYQAFSTTAWNLWTRCFELIKLKRKDLTIDFFQVGTTFTRYLNGEKLCLKDLHTYFEVFLSNRKGWQRRVDKGTKESDLRSNQYKLYPQPDLPGCNCFFWLLLWLTFLEVQMALSTVVNLSRTTLFKHGSTKRPQKQESHEVQWHWMFAPIGQHWTLARVRWWGSWAENENRDTLIRYLLNELSTYENDHSDALCPTQCEADASLLGEHLLVKPVCIQDLQSMHECISADVAGLQSDLRTLAATLYNGQLTNLPNSPSSTGMCNAPHSSTLLSNPGNPCVVHHSSQPPSSESQPRCPAILSSTLPQPSALTQITDSGIVQVGSHSLVPPEKGLVIPDVPTRHPDGTHTPRAASWRQIVKHWTDGDPKHRLLLPLRDWPPEWIRGKNKKFFAMKYHQRSVIALEFLDRFNGHEPVFLAAYPEATVGHTALLWAINRAKKECGDIIPRKYTVPYYLPPTSTSIRFSPSSGLVPSFPRDFVLSLCMCSTPTTAGRWGHVTYTTVYGEPRGKIFDLSVCNVPQIHDTLPAKQQNRSQGGLCPPLAFWPQAAS